MLRLLKFTLDLFDVPPVHEPVSKPPPQLLPTTPAQIHGIFSHHPQASQQTHLHDRLVNYELIRSRKRGMTFSVSAAGLSVRAPFGMLQPSIEAAVQEKATWIVRKLTGMQQREETKMAQKMNWQAGAQLAYLGGVLSVCIDPLAAETVCHATPDTQETGKAWRLLLALPTAATDKKIRDTTQKWILQKAIQHYTARMNHYAVLLGVTWKSLSLTNANTRWGSAKSDGSIRLHWRLMQFSPDVIDYVVAHELSHLRELNHSPRFWATVASVMPDYKVRQKELKAQVLPLWE
jgi:predicted metal-dependent hydrolase